MSSVSPEVPLSNCTASEWTCAFPQCLTVNSPAVTICNTCQTDKDWLAFNREPGLRLKFRPVEELKAVCDKPNVLQELYLIYVTNVWAHLDQLPEIDGLQDFFLGLANLSCTIVAKPVQKNYITVSVGIDKVCTAVAGMLVHDAVWTCPSTRSLLPLSLVDYLCYDVWVCVCICVCIMLCVHIYIYMYVCVYVYYICIYICIQGMIVYFFEISHLCIRM